MPHPKGAVPVPRDRGHSGPKIFGTSCMRAHSMRNNNQMLHGDHTKREENFYSVPQMLTRDLFAVATFSSVN